MHNRDQFLHIQRAGLRTQTRHFVMYAASAEPATAVRLGVTVARRIGSAVVRNRIKRHVRECFRLFMRELVPPGTDLVVIARQGAGELASTALREELTGAARLIGGRIPVGSGPRA